MSRTAVTLSQLEDGLVPVLPTGGGQLMRMQLMCCESTRAILQIKPKSSSTKLLFNGGSPNSPLVLHAGPRPPAHSG
jgi:hypothetical protein